MRRCLRPKRRCKLGSLIIEPATRCGTREPARPDCLATLRFSSISADDDPYPRPPAGVAPVPVRPIRPYAGLQTAASDLLRRHFLHRHLPPYPSAHPCLARLDADEFTHDAPGAPTEPSPRSPAAVAQRAACCQAVHSQ